MGAHGFSSDNGSSISGSIFTRFLVKVLSSSVTENHYMSTFFTILVVFDSTTKLGYQDECKHEIQKVISQFFYSI